MKYQKPQMITAGEMRKVREQAHFNKKRKPTFDELVRSSAKTAPLKNKRVDSSKYLHGGNDKPKKRTPVRVDKPSKRPADFSDAGNPPPRITFEWREANFRIQASGNNRTSVFKELRLARADLIQYAKRVRALGGGT